MSAKTIEISSLAQRLNELIARDGKLTPASLARKLGIPTNKITRILNGDVTDPKASTLLQIANCFGITIEQLLGIDPLLAQGGVGDLAGSRILPVFEMNNFEAEQEPKRWYRWLENGIEGNYFALHVDTDLYAPTFPKDSLLVINPDVLPEDRCVVVVQKKGNKKYSAIKNYVLEGDQAYLYPINPQLAIEIYDDSLYNVLGVVIEIHQKLRS